MSALNIPHTFRAYRRRALESQANVGSHAWVPGSWDADDDAAAYCLDAVDSSPCGSSRMFLAGVGSGAALREAYLYMEGAA